MKANAPERIWIDPVLDLPKLSGHINKNSVEYIKKDAFIQRVIDPYEQSIQYKSIKAGIQAHAETYSFNIESELFNQLTKEQQVLWRKEIEQACISGGEMGVELAKDPRYEEIIDSQNGSVKYVKLNNKDGDNFNDIPLDLIKKVTPIQDKEGNLSLIVEYYNDELCINCSAFCDYIEVTEENNPYKN